ncbi:MAG: [FeFe] hydrogenase, group A [Patescibacteria group bacterium]|jgi:NADP-reducing hydrogenase subunit HndD
MEVEFNGEKFEIKPHQTVLENQKGKPFKDFSDIAITRDESKCIGCGLCREVCLANNSLGIPVEEKVGECLYFRPDGKLNFSESNCTRCGQCVIACPTGTLAEKENIDEVKAALADPTKCVVAQVAPSVRVSVSESFGGPVAENWEEKIVAALKKLGFDYVFDVNVGADFTTYEEAHDLKERIEKNTLPLFTSCCPARVKYIEDFHPGLADHITTVRSPQQCLAVLVKTYFAKKKNIDPKDIVVVSIMPCIAKKFESRRQGEDKSGSYDVDWVLTTREFIKMVKLAKIDLKNITLEKFDSPLGEASGAGAIYGASGGVIESAVRTFAEIFHNEKLDKIDYQEFRGMEGIKKATLKIGGEEIKIAIATGLANAEKIIAEVNRGEIYHYVEVMACPGGCVGGGGQPKPQKMGVIDKRRKALYEIDQKKNIRKAHENPIVQQVYKEFLGCAGSPKAKKYLHTIYDKSQSRICLMEGEK